MYKIQKIPPLPNRDSLFLTGLNNAGQVIGVCYRSGLGLESGGIEHRAFFWMKEMAGQEEPMLLKAFSDAESFAYGINDRGDVVGAADHERLTGTSDNDFETHQWPALWIAPERGQVALDVPFRLPSPQQGSAHAINNQRMVVGDALPALWQPSPGRQMQRVPLHPPALTRDQQFRQVRLNNQGTILGNAFQDSRSAPSSPIYQHPWRYQNGIWSALPIPPDTESAATDLNDAEEIVGEVGARRELPRPYVWREGKGQFLSEHPGGATAINNKGEIVGTQRSIQNSRPCLWQDGKQLALETLLPPMSGWVLYDAVGINDNGQIIGHGALNGQRHGYLLTP